MGIARELTSLAAKRMISPYRAAITIVRLAITAIRSRIVSILFQKKEYISSVRRFTLSLKNVEDIARTIYVPLPPVLKDATVSSYIAVYLEERGSCHDQ